MKRAVRQMSGTCVESVVVVASGWACICQGLGLGVRVRIRGSVAVRDGDGMRDERLG